jgi:predicted RNA binding protein YcfA (HicA-like mRNA interferase family)
MQRGFQPTGMMVLQHGHESHPCFGFLGGVRPVVFGGSQSANKTGLEPAEPALKISPCHAVIVIHGPERQVAEELGEVSQAVAETPDAIGRDRIDDSEIADGPSPSLKLAGQFVGRMASRRIAQQMNGAGGLMRLNGSHHRFHPGGQRLVVHPGRVIPAG